MPERVHFRFDDHDAAEKKNAADADKTSFLNEPTALAHTVSSQGTKRKRNSKSRHVRPLETQVNPLNPQDGDKIAQKDNGSMLQVNGNGNSNAQRKSKPASTTHHRVSARNYTGHKSLADKRRELLEVRRKLPIWPHANKIRQSLRENKGVMLLVGETGSGKSTQVPQFLLDEKWCTGCIAITQPRRVAAISLARRVAEEMGTPLGSSSPASKVGYSVRFDQSVSPNTKIKYLTEGMLLQEFLRDPGLKQYSAVIVDEVHERSVNVDLILGFLRNLVCGDKSSRDRKPLKVAVMSATADVQKLFDFFEAGQVKSLPSPMSGSEQRDHNGVSGDGDTTPKPDNAPISKDRLEGLAKESESISICYIEGRQYPVQITYLSEPTQDFVESALKAVFQFHLKEPLPGDILVFLTGQDTVESLERLINEYAETMDPRLPKILALPLFAALPQAAQQRVFHPAPPKTRKIVLSTNIAETSVTVPGVRFVIDSGKHKLKQFRNRLGLDSLLVKPISRSSAVQRAGRAGREAPGKCVRLFTEKDMHALEKTGRPEILRCDLAQAIVTMKARGVEDVVTFPWLDAPPREALERALVQLFQLGALNETGGITDVGRTIAKLPLTPSLGRVLVEAAVEERKCLRAVIDIVAGLSVENIFLHVISEERREEVEVKRAELYRREGDHLTILAAVRGYRAEGVDRKVWCEKFAVSHRAMQNVMDIRKQLLSLCKTLGLLDADTALDDDNTTFSTTEAETEAILQSILRGFAANTARLVPDGSYRTLMGNQTVAIHPSSVLFGKKVEAIVFSEFVFTNKSYARGCSAVRLGWVDEVLAGF